MSQQQKKQRGGVTLSAVLAVRMMGAKAATKQFRHVWHLMYLLRRYFGKNRFDYYFYQAGHTHLLAGSTSFLPPPSKRLYPEKSIFAIWPNAISEKIDWAVWALLQEDPND